jgi:NADH-quinone oxidoreductase subunit N
MTNTLLPFLPFLPDVALFALALAILASDLGDGEGRRAYHVAWIGLATLAALIILLPAGAREGSFGGYRISSGTLLWKLLFTLAALGTVLLSPAYFRPGGNARGILTRPGAFFGLLVLCVQGMFALVSARDLLVFFLGLELATLPLYALAAFQPHDSDSVEAGSKYVLMGGFSSALSLFGISFLFGSAGGLGFDALSSAVQSDPAQPLLWGGAVFLLGGLGFKLSMAPLHMWAPDVYQGAPTPVMAFLSVGSKASAVAAVSILFLGPLNDLRPGLVGFISAAAVLSMVAGNLGAMRQSNLRRFVAYSSIAQVGYMLLAFLGDAEAARNALQYNLVAYGATSFALYFVMSVVGKDAPDSLSSLRGLSRRHPGLAALLLLCMFSLAGIPPLAGFLGKFLLFSTAASQGHYVLVGIAVANAVVSFYYYMLVVKEAYIAEPGHAPAAITLSWAQKLALGALGVTLLVLGLCPVAGNWLVAHGGP